MINARIPLSDGNSLAARVVLPDGEGRFPTLVTFYPYRKDDFIGAAEAYSSSYYADAGYASVLIDNRGYGSSTGRAYEAWDPREFEDGAEAVSWISQQAWSDGSIGVWGSSYGGAMALGVAAQKPPGLKAIASIYGAADIYHDFVYPGGCPNALGASAWAALMVAMELAPPTLQDAAGTWLTAWKDRLLRLAEGGISTLVWPAHPEYDDYWRRRNIPVESITAPAFFISGWRDLLCQGMLNAFERCQSHKRLLIGPWSHAAPDMSPDAPYDWLLELRLWWDRWLKCDQSVEERPNVIYWLQGANQWCQSDQWPPPEVSKRTLYPGTAEDLIDSPVESRSAYHCSADVGGEAGLWYPMGLQIGTFEQARDDARSLCFTSQPASADLIILGSAQSRLRLSLPRGESVHLTVKLCDVAPDGGSTLITSGWHKIASDDLADTFEVVLYPTAYSLAAGHRLRWTIAGADFPRIWPTPTEPDIALVSSEEDASAVTLPSLPPYEAAPARFEPLLPVQGLNRSPLTVRADPICSFTQDAAGDAFSLTAGVNLTITLPQGGAFNLENSLTASMRRNQPLSAMVETSATITAQLGTGEVVRVDTSGLSTLGRRHLSGKVSSGRHTLLERCWSSFNGDPLE